MALSTDKKWKVVNETWDYSTSPAPRGRDFCDGCEYMSSYGGSFYEPPSADCEVLDSCKDPERCPGVQAALIEDKIQQEMDE